MVSKIPVCAPLSMKNGRLKPSCVLENTLYTQIDIIFVFFPRLIYVQESIWPGNCMQLGPQTKESSPTGCLSVLKVGRSMVVITDNRGIKKSM